MPKVTEEHRQVRRQQILEAALNCFARKGLLRTTMKDICREAGVSAGAIYIYFASKEDIIEESWRRIHEARAARTETAKQTGPTIQALNEIWDEYERRLVHADTDRPWQIWIQLLAEAPRNPRIRESIRKNWDDGEKHTVELLSHAAERGMINPGADLVVVARLWQIVHDGLVLMKIIDPERDAHQYFEAYKKACRIMLSDPGNGKGKED
jgi:TetR/AcrR family transcriptional repressor of uid operon